MLHGVRRSYAHGCRCVLCRASNAAYVQARRTMPASRISATPARAHLAALHQLGIGSRHLAEQTTVSRSVIRAVLAGRLETLSAATSAQLLTAKPTLAHGACVAGTKTWRFVDSLEREGYTRRELAFRLGRHSQQLQLTKRRLTIRSALAVATLYQRLA